MLESASFFAPECGTGCIETRMEHDAFLPASERKALITANKSPNPAPLIGRVSSGLASVDLARHPVCKKLFRDGNVDLNAVAWVARTFAAIRGATAAYTDAEKAFRSRHVFIPIRLDPYLPATTLKHPECVGQPEGLASRPAKTGKLRFMANSIRRINLLVSAGRVFSARSTTGSVIRRFPCVTGCSSAFYNRTGQAITLPVMKQTIQA